MAITSLFPTRIYAGRLTGATRDALNPQLLRECRQLPQDDPAGVAWSKSRYIGGYTSYGSANRMHRISPTFAHLEKLLDAHVARFARTLEFDLRGRKLVMTDCWVNLMPPGVAHGSHLHPLSTISGTYYVATPAGSPGLKFEDPRLERMMAAPPRRARASRTAQGWITMPAAAGGLLLFESWLRHEVAANTARTQRISISFNYHWF